MSKNQRSTRYQIQNTNIPTEQTWRLCTQGRQDLRRDMTRRAEQSKAGNAKHNARGDVISKTKTKRKRRYTQEKGKKRASGKAKAVTRSDIIHEIRTATAIPKTHFSQMDASFQLIASRLCWLVNWHRCWCCRRILRQRIVHRWRRCCGACGGRNAAPNGRARVLNDRAVRLLSFSLRGVWVCMYARVLVGWSLDSGVRTGL